MPGEIAIDLESSSTISSLMPFISEGTVNLSSMVHKRFGALTSSPSKETLQSLARWVLFHRTHPIILSSLTGLFDSNISDPNIASASLPRKLVFLNVMHEILMTDSTKSMNGGDTLMWEKYHPFRVAVGEMVILPVLESIRYHIKSSTSSEIVSQGEKISERLKSMKDLWREVNSFDSPTLLDDMTRLLALLDKEIVTSKKKLIDLVDTSTFPTDEHEEQNNDNFDTTMDLEQHEQDDDYSFGQAYPSDDFKVPRDDHVSLEVDGASCGTAIDETVDEGYGPPSGSEQVVIERLPDDSGKPRLLPLKRKADSDNDTLVTVGDSPPRSIFTEQDDSVVLDEFDPQNIPLGQVDIHELDTPNNAIATMQITRDLHSESTSRLSALISTIPLSVFDTCLAIKDSNTTVAEALKSIGMQSLPDEFLDVDLEQALASLRLYKEIIAKQKEARKKCIELLIKSQCEIGFSCIEVAKLFYTMDSKLTFLNKKKEKIRDAMELEGLDFDAMHTETPSDGDEEEQKEFSWFERGDMTN